MIKAKTQIMDLDDDHLDACASGGISDGRFIHFRGYHWSETGSATSTSEVVVVGSKVKDVVRN